MIHLSVIVLLGVQFIIKYSNHVTEGFKCDLTVGSSVMNTATKRGGRGGLALLLLIPEVSSSNLRHRNNNHPRSVMTFRSSSRHATRFITHKNAGGPTQLSSAVQ